MLLYRALFHFGHPPSSEAGLSLSFLESPPSITNSGFVIGEHHTVLFGRNEAENGLNQDRLASFNMYGPQDCQFVNMGRGETLVLW